MIPPAIMPLMRDDLIDRFVEAVNARGPKTLPENEVPDELRSGPPDQFGWCQWKIRLAEPNTWVTGLEESVMPHRSPNFFSPLSRDTVSLKLQIGPSCSSPTQSSRSLTNSQCARMW